MKRALAIVALGWVVGAPARAGEPQAVARAEAGQGGVKGFAVRFLEAKRDVEEASERELLVGGVPYHVVIQALDAEGKPLPAFAARAEVKGLSALDEEGNEKPVERTEPFKDGKVVLENVFLSGDAVTVSHGAVTQAATPRVIPGWLTIVPPVLAIALAIVFRQVLVALLAGIWAGAIVIHDYNPLVALLRALDTHILDSLADPDHASIVLFTAALGGMIGVIGRSGGTRALVDATSRRAKSRRSGMIATWLMGLVVFFDDYANCLLVGNTMRPFTDSRRISREKLSFLVDATAAPVASIAIISTWIGFELSQLVNSGIVAPNEAYATFIATIPYRFYSVLMLLFVFAIAFTQRDIGPMLRAEQRAIATGQVLREGAQPLADRELTEMKVPEGKKLLWQNAVVPIIGVILIVVLGLYLSGRSALGEKA